MDPDLTESFKNDIVESASELWVNPVDCEINTSAPDNEVSINN